MSNLYFHMGGSAGYEVSGGTESYEGSGEYGNYAVLNQTTPVTVSETGNEVAEIPSTVERVFIQPSAGNIISKADFDSALKNDFGISEDNTGAWGFTSFKLEKGLNVSSGDYTLNIVVIKNLNSKPCFITCDSSKVKAYLEFDGVGQFGNYRAGTYRNVALNANTFLDFTNTTCSYDNLKLIFEPIGDSVIQDISTNITLTSGGSFAFSDYVNTQNVLCKRVSLTEELFADIVQESITFNVNVGGGEATVSPFNKLHYMTNEDLVEFSQVEMRKLIGGVVTSEGLQGATLVDLSDYIVNIIQFNFGIPDTYIGGTQDIILGTSNTGVDTPILTTDTLRFDFGAVQLPTCSNSVDLASTSYELVLPFIENSLQLPVEIFNGKSISIEWLLDVYNGDVTTNVFFIGDSSYGESQPVISSRSRIGRNIPVKLGKDNMSTSSQINGVVNNRMGAYVVCVKRLYEGGEGVNLITTSGTLEGYVGYLEVDSIDLRTINNSFESDAIKQVLRTGIVIN